MAKNSTADRIPFSERMIQILNDGALNLALAIGYQTGLLDAMDLMNAPQTAEHISQQTGLNQRYIEEWLGIMVTGEIVDLSLSPEGQNLYYLPKRCGDLITRRAGNKNLGVYAQEMPLLIASAMEGVIRGFETGAGVTYDHYPKFQRFMSQLADAKHRQVLVDRFLPSVDDGQLVGRLQDGIRVCDLGCGEGSALMLMAKAFPRSSFAGIDISKEAITSARHEAGKQHIGNLDFMILDAGLLPDNRNLEKSFDYVTAFDAIHDQTRPLDALKGVHFILAPDGVFSMVDIAAESSLANNRSHPMGPFLYTVSLMHCLPVGLVDEGAGLGMMWGRQKAVNMLKTAGFQNIQVMEMPDDPFNFHFFSRKQ